MAIDNNLIERQIKPRKLRAKNWLLVGSELAGRRAAVAEEPDAVGQARRAGSVGLPARYSGAHPLACEPADRRVAAASLASRMRPDERMKHIEAPSTTAARSRWASSVISSALPARRTRTTRWWC
ncbi:MAG: transposase [Burkholderiales bacterium]|nr:transposase [Burkholderiales bacterium]